MTLTLEAESTLTDRYQTTVPEPIRRALHLGKRDKIRYCLMPNGDVVITRVENSDEADPVLGQFLNFLAHDIASRPERLKALDGGLLERANELVAGIQVDLNEPLSADDE